MKGKFLNIAASIEVALLIAFLALIIYLAKKCPALAEKNAFLMSDEELQAQINFDEADARFDTVYSREYASRHNPPSRLIGK